MPVSDKLAYEIYIILLFHIPAIVILVSFCAYLCQKAKKNLVRSSFLSLAFMLLIWMVSKVMKTVSPNESIRWFFIVTQYLGVQFMGYFLVLFARVYTKDRMPALRTRIVLAILPALSFLVVATNPLHMMFYSYYDFYKDRFGPLFIPIQSIQYLYLLSGIMMLAPNYTHQPGFKGRVIWARFFAVVTMIPLLANAYYILFKLDVFPWIFSIPVFDFSPIAGTVALLLFVIPALQFRFFEISPISHKQIIRQMLTGIVFVTKKNNLYSPNQAFLNMFQSYELTSDKESLFAVAATQQNREQFVCFFEEQKEGSFALETKDQHYYMVKQQWVDKKNRVFAFSDTTEIVKMKNKLKEKNKDLQELNAELQVLSSKAAELSATRIKAAVAQNIHDILGHSLTVALCTADMALFEKEESAILEKLDLMMNLLNRSLEDLKNTVHGNPINLKDTTLIKAIQELSSPKIAVNLVLQGTPYELNKEKTEALFRTCQEAITNAIRHGKAEKIHMFLRFYPEKVELFMIDDGVGCKEIHKNIGLTGMETRIKNLKGSIHFGSDGIQGFHIYVKIE